MEATARLRYLRSSPQKVRLVADLIRGMNVQEAVTTLQFSRKAVSADLEKLLKSAIANAESKNEAVDVDQLYVKAISVDGGPTLKRIRPQPMGRAFRILKRTSHVTIKLDSKKSGEDKA